MRVRGPNLTLTLTLALTLALTLTLGIVSMAWRGPPYAAHGTWLML